MNFFSCESKNDDIQEVITRLEHIGFEDVVNTSMYLREAGSDSKSGLVYLGKANGKCGPYLIDYNFDNKVINFVDDKLVLNSCQDGFFESDEIEALIELYLLF